MNFDSPISENQVDPLVRAALAADGRAVDVARVIAEIKARLATAAVALAEAESSSPSQTPADPLPQVLPLRAPKRSGRRVLRWMLAAAACLGVAVGVGEWFALSATPASAYSLLESAHSVLAKSADRCYQVEMTLPKGWPTKNSFFHSDDRKLVWTRGDRFRFLMLKDGQQLSWGQDEEHRTWVVCDDSRGLFFDADEVPPALVLTLSYLSLDFERLSLEILENFDLKTEEPAPGADPGVITVLATAKPQKKSLQFQAARLEIDLKTRFLRKLELMRIAKKIVTARVTFTLLSEDPQSDASYTLEGNLPVGARVLDKEKATERAKLFRKLLM